MNHESLQLVQYDGQKIPNGYLTKEITARFAITYLKSLGASEEAVDKIKEVEVNRILYDIEILKAAQTDDGLGAMTLSKDGKSYGAGTGVPIPGSVVHALNDTGSLPEGWSISRQGNEQEMQQHLNTPVYLYKNGQGELEYNATKPNGIEAKEVRMADLYAATNRPRPPEKQTMTIKDKENPTKVVCSMTYEPGSAILNVDKLGKLPNIWANLLAAVGSFDIKEREVLEEKFNTSAGSKLSLSLEAIPEDIRDEIMGQVMDPSTHYGDILTTIQEKLGTKASEVLGHGLSEALTKKMGFALSESLVGLLNNVDFVHLINENTLQATALKRMFPILAKSVESAKDDQGNIPDNFEFTKYMFLVDLNGTSKQVAKDLSSLVDSLSNAYIGMSALYKTPPADEASGEKASKVAFHKGVDILMMPVVNMIVTEESSIAEDKLVELCKKQGVVGDSVKKAAKEIVDALKSGSLDEYSDVEYDDKDMYLSNKIASMNLSVEADVVLGAAVREGSLKFGSKNKGDFLEKYGPRIAKTGALRNPSIALSYLKALIPSLPGSSDPLKTQRAVNLTAGMLISSIGSFGGKSRDSDWELGKEHIAKSLSLLNTTLGAGALHIADLLPFAKNSPLIFEGDELPSRITYIHSDHTIRQMDYTGVETPESRQFALDVAQDLDALIKNPVLTSERALASTIIMNDPSLAPKIRITDVDPYIKSAEFEKAQLQVADVLGGFVEAFMDGPVGGVRDTTMAGGVLSKSKGYLLFKDLNSNNFDFLKSVVTTPPDSLADELALTEQIASMYPEEDQSTIDEAMRVIKGGLYYDATMKVLSDPALVSTLLSGQPVAAPKGVSPYQMSKVLANLDKFVPSSLDFSSTFDGDTGAADKAAIVRDALVGYISQSASVEAARRAKNVSDPSLTSLLGIASVVRHSDSFESVSSIGQLIAQMKMRPKETVTSTKEPVFKTQLSQELHLTFSGGETFTTGLRNNIDPTAKGGQLDMLGTTINKKERTMSLDTVELKVSGNIHQVADINATRQGGKAMVGMIQQTNPDFVYIKPVTNISTKYGTSVKGGKRSNTGSRVGTLSFNMAINAGTDMGADGNVGIGVLRR